MSARDVIAKALRDNTRVQASLHCAERILSALEAAGYAVKQETGTNWKQVAKDMIGMHDLLRRRGYFEAAESVDERLTAAKETP